MVVYGGEKVFAAGADIKEMADSRYAEMVERAARCRPAFDALARIPKPTVAAITGYALGGGCELALRCDFRVCGDNAKLGQPEILLGIIPGAGGTQRLPRLVGPRRAKDLIYTGRFVGGRGGARDRPGRRGRARRRRYSAAVAMAPAVRRRPARWRCAAAKAAIDGGLDGDLATGLRLETELFAGLFATEDRTIGMTSFVENGPGKAQFAGR